MDGCADHIRTHNQIKSLSADIEGINTNYVMILQYVCIVNTMPFLQANIICSTVSNKIFFS